MPFGSREHTLELKNISEAEQQEFKNKSIFDMLRHTMKVAFITVLTLFFVAAVIYMFLGETANVLSVSAVSAIYVLLVVLVNPFSKFMLFRKLKKRYDNLDAVTAEINTQLAENTYTIYNKKREIKRFFITKDWFIIHTPFNPAFVRLSEIVCIVVARNTSNLNGSRTNQSSANLFLDDGTEIPLGILLKYTYAMWQILSGLNPLMFKYREDVTVDDGKVITVDPEQLNAKKLKKLIAAYNLNIGAIMNL